MTSKIEISGSVDTKKAGVYTLTYSVEDSDSNKTTVTRKITVAAYLKKVENAKASSSSYNSNKITWNKVSGANGYKIYRATSKNGKYSSIKTITSGSTLSYINTGLQTGKTYYYKVRAYRLVNGSKVYGKYSSYASAKPSLLKPSISLSSGKRKAYIKWNKISGANGYEIYRSTSKNGKYSKIKTLTGTSYTNCNLSSKKVYYYKVRAYRNVNGKKVYSPYSSIKYIKIK